jgi:sarcosine oxidase
VLRFGDGADDWHPDGSGFAVHTAGGLTERADRVVLTAGAWLPHFLPDLALPLAIERVPLFWLEPARPDPFRGIPVYIVETDDGSFYGFPYLPDEGLKVARHGTGDRTDPDHVDRAIRPREDERVRRFVRAYMPGGDGPLRDAKVCMYTKTPDGHFIVDRHPRYPRVVFASACSGHGFKFASVMGEVLADLALTGTTPLPIGFLSLSRS